MVALRTFLSRAVVSLCIFAVTGCYTTFNVSDLEAVPEQPALHRYTIAHRGSLHEGLPDNSIPALKDALARGVSFLEVDVRLSASGELFLFHDGSAQTTNSFAPSSLIGRSIQKLSAEERAQIKLDREGTIGIPLLTDALNVLPSHGPTLQLDLKAESDDLLKAVVNILKKERMLDRVILQLRSPQRIAQLRADEPTALISARCVDGTQLNQALAERVSFVELERWMTAEAIHAAHSKGIAVTFNVAGSHYDEPTIWQMLRARGIDSIMTNHAVDAR
jgi:glycerophosphoryl diester phosphodiesterase